MSFSLDAPPWRRGEGELLRYRHRDVFGVDMSASRDASRYVYSPELEDSAAWVLREAERRGLRIAAAESCTGGALAALLTDVEGLSHVFERGYAVYSEAAKRESLGVPAELLESHGAVSREAAEAMAAGCLERSRAEVSIAVTGNAGPAGADEEPGLVYLCVAVRGGGLRHQEHHFGRAGRSEVRIKALQAALSMLGWAVDAACPKEGARQ